MTKIKFGTDGWRAIIAEDFTVDNVARVAEATAKWVKQNFEDHKIVIGHDCRFAGKLFVETLAKVFVKNDIKVLMANTIVSTPMLSMAAKVYGTSLGVIVTASHNPPTYSGIKLKGNYGGPLLPEQVQEVEDIIEDKAPDYLKTMFIDELIKAGKIEMVDLETMYVNAVEKNFDLDAIKNSNLQLAFDAMYGSGQDVMRRLFPDITLLHCEHNPSFDGQAPEPIHKNLLEFSEMIRISEEIDCGLAIDGDADRIGLYNSKGEFVDSHHIILLLIHYLVKYKGMKAKVCTAFSTTERIKKMCDHYGLELEVVKIGFKYICSIMLKEDVLVGGEESGGIAVKNHIPERDGIWMGLIIWEFMAKSGKTLEDLIEEVYEITGPFAFQRNDLHLKEEQKIKIIENCKNNVYKQFGDRQIERLDDLDGFKFFFNADEWVMIRPSGTEPVLRVYSESYTMEKAEEILKITKEALFASI
jgi:phosphomannomutase